MFSQNGSSASSPRAPDVAGDHHDLAVPTVDERAAERREQEARQHARDHHEADRGRRSDTRPAIERIAIRPVQSPRLETNCAPNSGRKLGTLMTRHGAGGIASRRAPRE